VTALAVRGSLEQEVIRLSAVLDTSAVPGAGGDVVC
jgi:hypothetical protein